MVFSDDLIIAKRIEQKTSFKEKDYFLQLVLLARLFFTRNEDSDYIYDEIFKRLCTVYSDFSELTLNKECANIVKLAHQVGVIPKQVVSFSPKELEYIHSFDDIRLEKALFVMFCVYKVSERNMFEIKPSHLLGLAMIPWKQKNFNLVSRQIYLTQTFDLKPQDGVLYYVPKPNILNLYQDDNICLTIDSFDNLVYYYLEYINYGKFIRCENCGTIETTKSNNTRYCKVCSVEFTKERNRNRNSKKQV